ncbi:MAG: phytoene desaturase, partial [Sphingomonadales bacterium]|nr:phytoene desaturase [Sphingomonadales bacterium]
MSRVCVIGAGFGGLALALRLQAAGMATTLVEAGAAPGGRAAQRTVDDMTFDLCPATIDDVGGLQELWALAGRDVASDVTLLPVQPLWRLNWPDSTQIDWTADAAAMARGVARLAPGDLAGYQQFMAYAAEMRAVGTFGFGEKAHTGAGMFARALPLLVRQQAWRSLDGKARALVKSEKLRLALTFRVLMKGGNPLTVPALHAATLRTEAERGTWWPQGGVAALARAMAALFAAQGGELRLGDPALRIHALGNRASEVSCASGWRAHFDAVASNADVMHTYRTLLAKTPQG